MPNAPSVHNKVTTYGIGTPRLMRTNAAATSNAIGTGRNVPTSATSTMPGRLTWTGRFCAGNNSATNAPSNAARIINGIVVTAKRARLRRNIQMLPDAGCSNPSLLGSAQSSGSAGEVRRTIHGTIAISTSGTASRTSAILSGNRLNAIASTTMFNVGELIIVARTVLALAPAVNSPCPIGATQLAQTPSGTPVIAPNKVFAKGLRKRRRGNVASKVSAAAPKQMPNVMPIRLVHIQLAAVCHTRVNNVIPAVTGNKASKLIAPLTLIPLPLCNFFSNAGYRESTQKYAPTPRLNNNATAVCTYSGRRAERGVDRGAQAMAEDMEYPTIESSQVDETVAGDVLSQQ